MPLTAACPPTLSPPSALPPHLAADSIPSFRIKKNRFPTTTVNTAFNKAVSYTTRDLWKDGKVRDGCKLAGPPTKIKGCYDSVVPGTLKGKQVSAAAHPPAWHAAGWDLAVCAGRGRGLGPSGTQLQRWQASLRWPPAPGSGSQTVSLQRKGGSQHPQGGSRWRPRLAHAHGHMRALPPCLSSSLQIKGKYGFEFAAKWECPGMCTDGLCTWEYTCHIRVSTRRDGSYWRTPKLRCE